MPDQNSATARTPELDLPRSVREYLDNRTPEGERNPELNKAAWICYSSDIPRDYAEPLLLAKAVADGLGEAEARATINSAYNGTKGEPAVSQSGAKKHPTAKGIYTLRRRPVMLPSPDERAARFISFMEVFAKPGDRVNLVPGNAEGDPVGTFPSLKRESWIEWAKGERKNVKGKLLEDSNYAGTTGLFFSINPTSKPGHKDENVTDYRHVLVEFDGEPGFPIDLDEQLEKLLSTAEELALDIASITDTGGKSLHALVRVDAPDEKEYGKRVADIHGQFPGVDEKCKSPSWLSRLPMGLRTGDDGQVRPQRLLWLNGKKIEPLGNEWRWRPEFRVRKVEPEIEEPTLDMPTPLPDALSPVAPFDYALMPEPFQAFTQDNAERLCCAPDYIAVSLMVAAGSVVGNKVGIRPKELDDYMEHSNVWGAIVGRPSAMKSPAKGAGEAPLGKLKARAKKDHTGEMGRHKRVEYVAKQRRVAADKDAKKAIEEGRTPDLKFMDGDNALTKPTLRRYSTQDATHAALHALLMDNPSGVLVNPDELASLLAQMSDKDTGAVYRSFYLGTWSGKETVTLDRIGRGDNLEVENACTSTMGTIQPGKLAPLVDDAMREGKGDDGLLQRFSMLVYPDAPQHKYVDREPDSEAAEAVARVFDNLDTLEGAEIGAETDGKACPYFHFTAEAQEIYVKWYDENAEYTGGGDLHPALESHIGKYRKLVAGIALLSHLCSGDTGAIGRKHLERALAWAEYLETHAVRVYGAGNAAALNVAGKILAKLADKKFTDKWAGGFAAAAIYRSGWAGLKGTEPVNKGLELLADYDWLTKEVVATGGAPKTIWHAHPKALNPGE